jgi:hypothetical protein
LSILNAIAPGSLKRGTYNEVGICNLAPPFKSCVMKSHFEMDDKEFELQFATCKLNPELFTHEAHLRLAWIHIKNYGPEAAIENICNQLISYTKHVGAADKYNVTVTIAAIRAVNHFINKSGSNSFLDFVNEFPRLKFNFKKIIAAHYKTDIFKSGEAKQNYIEPELLPFA